MRPFKSVRLQSLVSNALVSWSKTLTHDIPAEIKTGTDILTIDDFRIINEPSSRSTLIISFFRFFTNNELIL